MGTRTYPRTRLANGVLPLACVVCALGCAPTEISEERFQSAPQTCYEFPIPLDAGVGPQASFRSGVMRPRGCEDVGGFGGSLGNEGVGNSGGSSFGGTGAGGAGANLPEVGAGGSDLGSAGAGPLGVGGMPMAMPGGAGGGETGGAGGAPSDPPLSAECSALKTKLSATAAFDNDAVVLALFAASVDLGGCQSNDGEGGCHEAGTTNQLDLVSPNLVPRLRGGYYMLNAEEYECEMYEPASRTWITTGGDETNSFIWQKVNSDYDGVVLEKPPCGDAMPAFPGTASSLDASDRECLRQWIRVTSASGI